MTPLAKVISIVQRLACIGSHKPIFYDKPAGAKTTEGPVQRAVLMAFVIQSGLLASQITNTCGICTMTYSFEECNIITRVSCSVQSCIDIPRLSDSQCQISMTTKQGGVRSVDTDSGSASIRGCVPKTGGGVECGDNPTRCGEISYYKAKELKPAVIEMAIENSFGNIEGPLLSYNCVWTGESIFYTVINTSPYSLRLSWPGTPLDGLFVVPGQSQFASMSLSQAPIVTEQRLTAKDSVSGLGFVATATTIVDGPPRLNVTRNGSSKIQVRWLTNAVGYHLEQKAVFDSTPWNGLTNNLAVIGDEFVVDIGTTSARTFLRLAQ